jgi:Uma2 family endonuclease
MNAPLPPPPALGRHKFTVDDAIRGFAAGVFGPEAELELIDGDLYEMASDGPRTRRWNAAIARWLFDNLGPAYVIMPDKTLPVSTYYGPQPDFYVYDAALREEDVSGANVLLVIEVSDATLEIDTQTKAPRYAAGGVRDYWVIDCEGRRVLAYRLQSEGIYGEARVAAFNESLAALLIPTLALRLADLSRLD